MMNKLLTGLSSMIWLTICTTPTIGQNDFKLPETREVIVNTTGDSTIKAHIFYGQHKSIRPKSDRLYHWYSANSIRINVGNYDGKLLSGPYKIFNKENNMVLKGMLKKGLKHGEWMSWNTDGGIKYSGHWKKGKQHGKWTYWYANGQIKSIETWRKGKQSGRFFSYDTTGKLIEKSQYRNGNRVGKGLEYDSNSGYNKVKYVELKPLPKEKSGQEKTGRKKKDEKSKRNSKTETRGTTKEKKNIFNFFQKDEAKKYESKRPKSKDKKEKNKSKGTSQKNKNKQPAK